MSSMLGSCLSLISQVSLIKETKNKKTSAVDYSHNITTLCNIRKTNVSHFILYISAIAIHQYQHIMTPIIKCVP